RRRLNVSAASPNQRQRGLPQGGSFFHYFNPVRSSPSWQRRSRWRRRQMLCITSLTAAPLAGSSSQSDSLLRERNGYQMKKYKIAVLDDYQNVAQESADWSVFRDRADIAVFQNHLADPD